MDGSFSILILLYILEKLEIYFSCWTNPNGPSALGCIFFYLRWNTVNCPSCCDPPSPVPEEVLGSRWEVMELCGSVGGDMTSCQALMQANIWRLLDTSLLACRQGPLAWGQEPPRGTYTQGQSWASETGSRNSHGDTETKKSSSLSFSYISATLSGK